MNRNIEELKHWIWTTQKNIDSYCQKLNVVMNINPILGMPNVRSQHLNSAAEGELHSLVNSADHMFKAFKLSGLKESLVDESLKRLVHNLRNLREHWDANQQYFENSDLTIPEEHKTASARWFKKRYPDMSPWSGGWTNLCGYTTGPLYLGQLYEQGNRFLFAIEKGNLRESV